MRTKHAILRMRRSVGTRDPFALTARAHDASHVLGNPTEEVELRLDVDELSTSDVRMLANDPSVLALAPSMPITLIKAANATEATDWGIKAVGANTSSQTGKGVCVAVLDTGIDAAHPAFAGVRLVQRDFTGTHLRDGNGHGTHCAGTIFGRDVDGTRIGVAPGVDHALIGKVLTDDGSGTADALYSALQWAFEQGAKVISMSLGFDYPGLVERLVDAGRRPAVATSVALEAFHANVGMFGRLMDLLRARELVDGGAVVVGAAGNESDREDPHPYEIAASLPAAADGVISVAALQPVGDKYRVAPFSNTLATIAAPGVKILSARPGGGLQGFSGTSQAAPHVAGVCALWWSALRRAQGVAATARLVTAKTLSSARSDVFADPDDIADRGVGLVTAPQ